ncbi:hypothetical protein RSOLAG1IB_11808 [Rhizoctonia solani AG-1 IB]|uniref:Uncharacterized protein n=1 Tax=Thanatephorus cucumeris (strain AG1-IB / isolate 7/3/14) TaxID=1108050 RepID=A0A0B7FAA5_THACB|nr:hypothetical protein RSOLAG1IB_11808 [Rhizoctonia solani AG-1 IB]
MSGSVSVNEILTPEELAACRAYFISTSKDLPERLAEPSCFRFWARLVSLTLRQNKADGSDTIPGEAGTRNSASIPSPSDTILPSVAPITSTQSSAATVVAPKPSEPPVPKPRELFTEAKIGSNLTTPASLLSSESPIIKGASKQATPTLSAVPTMAPNSASAPATVRSSVSSQQVDKTPSKKPSNGTSLDGRPTDALPAGKTLLQSKAKNISPIPARQIMAPTRQTAKRSSPMPSSAITVKTSKSSRPQHASTAGPTSTWTTKETATRSSTQQKSFSSSPAPRTATLPNATVSKVSSDTTAPSVASHIAPSPPVKVPSGRVGASTTTAKPSPTSRSGFQTVPNPAVALDPATSMEPAVVRTSEEPKITIHKSLYDELMRIYRDHKSCQLKPQVSASQPIPKEPKALQKGGKYLPSNRTKRKYDDINGRDHCHARYNSDEDSTTRGRDKSKSGDAREVQAMDNQLNKSKRKRRNRDRYDYYYDGWFDYYY